jgi:hypothetical protein
LQEIQLKKQALDAFDEAVVMFEDQPRLQEKFQREAHRHEIHSLKKNYELLKSRMDTLKLFLKPTKDAPSKFAPQNMACVPEQIISTRAVASFAKSLAEL